MKISVITTIAAGFVASATYAEDINPTAVSFNEGAVEQSLSGVAGDAANGRIIVGDKGQGNCVACHQVTDLADVPFQGEIGPMLDGAGQRQDHVRRQHDAVVLQNRRVHPSRQCLHGQGRGRDVRAFVECPAD